MYIISWAMGQRTLVRSHGWSRRHIVPKICSWASLLGVISARNFFLCPPPSIAQHRGLGDPEFPLLVSERKQSSIVEKMVTLSFFKAFFGVILTPTTLHLANYAASRQMTNHLLFS
jgi:hypothetical protein